MQKTHNVITSLSEIFTKWYSVKSRIYPVLAHLVRRNLHIPQTDENFKVSEFNEKLLSNVSPFQIFHSIYFYSLKKFSNTISIIFTYQLFRKFSYKLHKNEA